MKSITVNASKTYDVVIGGGLLADCGSYIKMVHSPCRALLVSDDRVFGLYGKSALDSLNNAGFDAGSYVFNNGEASKTIATYARMLESAAERELSRSDLIIALGGGVTGDMAGFCAATYMRGVDFVQLPTTLLAAVDSSVGGKTAVDLKNGKNLAGAFHQPSLVLCDVASFATLTPDTFSDGAAEALKHGVLSGNELFEKTANGGLQDDIENIVAANVCFKRDIVQSDERESGKRKLLNLGHTFGHAYELLSGYKVTHGRAVAAGMAAAARASDNMGFSDGHSAERIANALKRLGLPDKLEYDANDVGKAMLSDKKRSGGNITLVLIRKIGNCVLHDVPTNKLIEYVKAGL